MKKQAGKPMHDNKGQLNFSHEFMHCFVAIVICLSVAVLGISFMAALNGRTAIVARGDTSMRFVNGEVTVAFAPSQIFHAGDKECHYAVSVKKGGEEHEIASGVATLNGTTTVSIPKDSVTALADGTWIVEVALSLSEDGRASSETLGSFEVSDGQAVSCTARNDDTLFAHYGHPTYYNDEAEEAEEAAGDAEGEANEAAGSPDPSEFTLGMAVLHTENSKKGPYITFSVCGGENEGRVGFWYEVRAIPTDGGKPITCASGTGMTRCMDWGVNLEGLEHGREYNITFTAYYGGRPVIADEECGTITATGPAQDTA